MKYDYTSIKNIYIVCGKTDMRKGIDGLATLVQDVYELDPYEDAIFLFSGRSKYRYKCLYFDGDGFVLLYKRLDAGKLQWPKDENAVRLLSQKELRWLLEGLSIQQPKAIPTSLKESF
jgi:transposase